jgi:hypothetical protein
VIAFPVWPVARYKLIDKTVFGSTAKSSGSETTRAPFGTMKVSEPENVSVLRVEVLIARSPDWPDAGRESLIRQTH